jgi:hypothetical protein
MKKTKALATLNEKLNNFDKYSEELNDIVVRDEKGEVKLDSAGKPVFKESIEMVTNSAEIMAIWTCCQAIMEKNLVAEHDIEAIFELMNILARRHDLNKTTHDYAVILPANYFYGAWKVVSECKAYHIFAEDKPMDKAVSGLAIKLARHLDAFHEAKGRDDMIQTASPDDVLKFPKLDSTKEYYSANVKEPALIDDLPQDHNK